MKQLFFTILISSFSFLQAYSQGWVVEENNFETNWNFTFQIGQTALLSEVNKDFSGSTNDMNNQADWGYNFQLSKMVWERFDLGLEFGVSNYKGFKQNPSNVNGLMLHRTYNNEDADFQPFPIYYDSDVTNFTVFFKYNFINFSSWSKGFLKMNMYLKMGMGVAFPSAELGYKDQASYEFTGLSHPFYLKGRYPKPGKDSHSFFSPALGINYQLSDRWFFSAETSFQFVGADNLDGIHNYNRDLRPEYSMVEADLYRVRVWDMTAKFLFGVSYFFNFDTHRQIREQQMPWFHNQYRSYYSKYQKKSTKKAQQERLPFFNKNFKNDRK